jgi:MFS family permease
LAICEHPADVVRRLLRSANALQLARGKLAKVSDLFRNADGAIGQDGVSLPPYHCAREIMSTAEDGLPLPQRRWAILTPWSATVALIAPLAGRLADRYRAGILCGLGLGMLTAGFVLLAALPAQPHAADIVWRMIICGFGFGLFGSPNTRAIITSAPRERSGGADAIQSTARLLEQTVGSALVALIFGVVGPSGGIGATAAILLAAGFTALAAVLSFLRLSRFARFPRSPRRADPAPAGKRQPRTTGE